MQRNTKIAFLLLVLAQGLHSVEEYRGRLWENFPPARFLCNLFFDDPERGFVIMNILLFLIGMLCWLLTHLNRASTAVLVPWIVIELINGVGHPVWAIYTQAYAPGMFTSPILFLLAIYLAKQLKFSGPT